MLYREAGQYKSTYSADMAVFPLKEDRIGIAVILAIALVAIPFLGSDFFIASVSTGTSGCENSSSASAIAPAPAAEASVIRASTLPFGRTYRTVTAISSPRQAGGQASAVLDRRRSRKW